MSKTAELKKILLSLNNIYLACVEADEATLDEVEIENNWTTNPGEEVKKLDKQKVILHFTLKGVKRERP